MNSGAMKEDLQSEAVSQFLTFDQESEVFAIDIYKVREVLEVCDITRLPRTPDFMRGVINLRGKVVPIVDLKIKFGLGETVFTVDTCIIIVEIVCDDELIILGLLTDSVREVIDLTAADIDPPPKIGTQLDAKYIKGMGKYNGDFIILLDVDRLLSIDELTLAKGTRDASGGKLSSDAKEPQQKAIVHGGDRSDAGDSTDSVAESIPGEDS